MPRSFSFDCCRASGKSREAGAWREVTKAEVERGRVLLVAAFEEEKIVKVLTDVGNSRHASVQSAPVSILNAATP